MLFTSSIRRILYIVVLLAILPALCIIVYAAMETRERVINEMRARSSGMLGNLAGQCRTLVESTRVLLVSISQLHALRDNDLVRISTLLRNLLASQKEYMNIFLADARGKIIASALPMTDEHNIAHEKYFQETATGETFVFGGMGVEPLGKNACILCAVPLLDEDNEGGRRVLAICLKPDSMVSFDEELHEELNGETQDKQVVVHLRDERGRLVFTYPPGMEAGVDAYERAAWEGISRRSEDRGEIFLVDTMGQGHIMVYERLRTEGMAKPYVTIELSTPHTVAYAYANAALIRDILLLAAASLAALGIAYFMGSRVLVQPVLNLVQAASAVAGGKLDTRASFGNLKGEMGQLVATFDEMAAALEARNIELVNAKDSADVASKAKSEFLTHMSHEIRTPMNAVIGMAYLALKSDLSEKQKAYVGKIYTAANTLLGIINDILDFSRIEAGKLAMEDSEFNLDDILDNIASLVGQKAEEKGIEVLFGVDSNVPTLLVGDPLRLGQVLTNLLNNAVKFTNKGEIIVSCTLDASLWDRVRLRFVVKDTGIGMTQEQQERLFTAFTQADGSITRRFGGTGLGLTITKRLVELMGGTIQIVSEKNKGTTVIFTASFDLPYIRNGQPEARRGNLTRVLVVDDNGPACRMMQNILNSMHFRADCAESPAEAFAMLWQEDGLDPYKIVLMDWRMPGMDGVEATWRLRTELNLANVPPVFITTALGRSEVLQQAKLAGAIGVLYKPIKKTALFDSLMEALHGRIPAMPRSPLASLTLPENRTPSFAGISVLLAEDNPINQQVATELLESAQADVTIVGNGVEALAAVEASSKTPPFDLVLMDLEMPEMDGYETARRLRADNRSRLIPIIAMTAHVMAEEKQRCLDAGMNDHIAKPIEVEKFFATLARWVAASNAGGASARGDACADLDPGDGPTKTFRPSAMEGDLHLPGLETEKALARLGNNERLYIKLLKQFLSFYENTESQFYTALDRGDTVSAQRIAHTLKGLAGSIGADGLAGASAFLESSFANNDPKVIRALAKVCFADLAKVQGMLRHAFAAERDEKDQASKEGVAAPALTPDQQARKKELLESLSAYLSEDDAEAAAFFLTYCREFETLLPGEVFFGLKSSIARFEFEDALNWIGEHADAAAH